MTIIFVISYLNHFGGTERVATSLANSLCVKHDITLLSRWTDKPNAYSLTPEVQDVKLEGSALSFISKIKRHVKESNPDIVVIHTMSKLTPLLVISGLQAKHIVSLEHVSFHFHSYPFQLVRKLLYEKLSSVVTLTESDKKNYTSFSKHVEVIPNAYPLSIAEEVKLPRPKVVLAIGRLTHQKGFDLLIDAWAVVEAKHPDWELHIYGEGKEKSNLHNQVNELKLKKVRFQGLSTNIIKAYQEATIFALSSRYEGFGMVLVEAQSQGLPIVSFDCPSGPAEIIEHQKNGLLIENGNTEYLAKGICELIVNETKRKLFSEHALISAKAYEPDVITKQWLTFFDGINNG